MKHLPPLRTVRAPSPPPAAGASWLDATRLPPEGKAFLSEIVTQELLTQEEASAFLTRVSDRVHQFTTRDRLGDALAADGRLTRYQVNRAMAGQYHGLRINNYIVRDKVGSGTGGLVFLGEHEFLKRKVAIKVLPADEDLPNQFRERFATEARVLSTLDHPHIIRVLDAGVMPSPGQGQQTLYYHVLEYMPGGDVEQHVYTHGTLTVPNACEWGRQAASGLRAIHDAGLVHRDLKPSNMVLTATGRVKLLDFGLVREYASTRTNPRAVLGSLDFISPEQLSSAATVGPPGDIYSLGVTLFWVMTGQLPLPAAANPTAAAENLRKATPKRLKEYISNCPPAVDVLLAKMLSKNPGERPTAAQVMATLTPLAAPSPDTPGAVGYNEVDRLRAAVELLEMSVRAKAADADTARAAVLTALGAAAATRPGEPSGHLRRIRGYVRYIAGRLVGKPEWPMLADALYLETLSRAAAAHDIGLIGVPDVALNRGPMAVMDQEYLKHPAIGCQILFTLASTHGSALPFLRVTRDIVRHHHERWDGTGYPEGQAGASIPAAARLVAVAIQYDDLRRGGMAHAAAVEEVQADSGRAFDPQVVTAFVECASDCERLFAAVSDDSV